MSQPTKKRLKPVCLAIARLRPNESTALAMKESHLFPTWWANPQKTSETSVFGNSAASTYGKHNSRNERKPLEVIRGNVQKQAKVANITARHWQRKMHNTQAFKPAVCHPRAARRTLRESSLGPLAQSLFNITMPRGLAPSGKKLLYRTTDWAWKGFAGIKNTMRITPLTLPNQTRSQTPKQPN